MEIRQESFGVLLTVKEMFLSSLNQSTVKVLVVIGVCHLRNE